MKVYCTAAAGLEKYGAHSEILKEKPLWCWFYDQWRRHTHAGRNLFICLDWGMKETIWGTLSYLLRHVALTVSCCDISFGTHKQSESLSLLHTPILYAPTSPLCLPMFSHIQAAFICLLPRRPSVWKCKQNKEHHYKVRCSSAAVHFRTQTQEWISYIIPLSVDILTGWIRFSWYRFPNSLWIFLSLYVSY